MTRYVIVSHRVGEPGDDFDAEDAAARGVNVDALESGGFIRQVSDKKPLQRGKKETEPDTESQTDTINEDED